MSGETIITIVGNAVDTPELRFTPSGAAVAKFRIASTPRNFDRQTNEWKDGDTLFLTVNSWRQLAENVAESIERGTRVVVRGRLQQRSYETKDGEKRTVYEIEADEVAPSLRNATAKVTKAQRGQQPNRPQNQQPAQGDPWGQPGQHGQNSGWGVPQQQDSPPF